MASAGYIHPYINMGVLPFFMHHHVHKLYENPLVDGGQNYYRHINKIIPKREARNFVKRLQEICSASGFSFAKFCQPKNNYYPES